MASAPGTVLLVISIDQIAAVSFVWRKQGRREQGRGAQGTGGGALVASAPDTVLLVISIDRIAAVSCCVEG